MSLPLNPLLFLILFLGNCLVTVAQSTLPMIHASADLVDIQDGDKFKKGQWTLAPEYKPDVYETSQAGKQITFYTDLDSISYVVHPDSVYDFVILLNDKDTAWTQIRYKPSHLDILKGAGDYGQETSKIPNFTYQDASNENLVALRKAFNLDSIAGKGHQVSQILNLMHWIHALVPHDGNHPTPEVKNAMSMISKCKKDERGLNCRGLAIVLNECYLAMGFKSRFVTCMPKDSSFNECHVINMVWANDLNKWIWVDPTHDAYIMDETGTLLGFAEVRERLINDQPLILNPDANWNKRSSTVKEYYLMHYMAKNLYRFSSPLHSKYNCETDTKDRVTTYMELIPLDAYQQLPKVVTEVGESSGLTYTTYKTNSPEVFWAPPK